jgi:hypothetical protein
MNARTTLETVGVQVVGPLILVEPETVRSIIVESVVITVGKRNVTCTSRFKSFRTSADLHGIAVEAELGGDVAEKTRDRRLSIGYTGHIGGGAA